MTDPAKQIRMGTLVSSDKAVDAIRQIVPYGFESFSVTFWGAVNADLKKLARDVKDAIGDHDAVISSVALFGNPLEEGEGAKACADGWKKLIDNAHLFGTDIVAGFTGRLRGKPIEASIPRYKKVFEPLAKRALDKGVRLAFENCDWDGTWQNGDFNIAHTPKAWEMMFNAFPSENVGLEWEPCHQMIKLIDPIPQLRKWVKKVFHVHGKDATILWDVVREHGVHGAERFAYHRTPGFGDSNWTDIISILRQGGFKGSIDIEGWHDPVYRGELEMTGQVRGVNYLKECRGGAFVPNY